MAPQDTVEGHLEELESVVIRLAGDSGDGMQLTGGQFTRTAALIGNDISTFPDFPAEIRAPAGSLPGVSSFQLNFSSRTIHTPGDQPNVLVAMNPAGLKTNIRDLEEGGILIINTDAFSKNNLNKAHYDSDPLNDGSLSRYRVFKVPVTSLNSKALEELEMSNRRRSVQKFLGPGSAVLALQPATRADDRLFGATLWQTRPHRFRSE